MGSRISFVGGVPSVVRVEKPSAQVTSDKLADSAKQFLDSADIRRQHVGSSTLRILAELDPQSVTPEPGVQLRIRTQKSLNMIAVVAALLGNRTAQELVISTYTLNAEALDILGGWVDAERVERLRLLIASSYGFRDADHKARIEAFARQRRDRVSLAFVWSHFKITLMAVGSDRYQIEGSMNYSQNNMAEQLLIENDPASYDHDHDFIGRIMMQTGHAATEVITPW